MKRITQYEYYTIYEDLILNQDIDAALVFYEKNDEVSNDLLQRLTVLSNYTKALVLCLDAYEAIELADDLGADNIPYIIIYESGEIKERFICSNEYEMIASIHAIEEM